MTQKIVCRLPNWLGDVCMAMPVIKAMQNKHPGAEFAFLTQPQYVALLDKLAIQGEKIPLPAKNWHYFLPFLQKYRQFDKHVLFTNSERGDVEAWLMRSKQRFGIARPNKPRKLLTHRFTLSAEFDEQAWHQTLLWRDFTAQFDLHDGVDFSPCLTPIATDNAAVGLICGSANTPEKRWAVESWQTVTKALLSQGLSRIVLIGTPEDSGVCERIASAVNDPRVDNQAGKTTLAELVDVMRNLSLVIGNDTGGLHIANALGVPVVGLYGYTNPVRCHPIFNAPVSILPSPDYRPNGMMNDITVDSVLAAAQQYL